MSEVKWDCTETEKNLVAKIVARARKEGLKADGINLMMDIVACHRNGNPLDLDGLLFADPFNFTHDVGGIQQHINRETGKLGRGFRPRHSK